LELIVCSKYLTVGVMEVRTKIGGSHHTSMSDGVSENVDEALPGFPMPRPESISSGAFQDNFEIAAQKNFLLKEGALVPLYRRASDALGNVSLAMFPKSWSRARPLWRGIATVEGHDGLLGRPTFYRQSDRAKLAERAAYYNRLRSTWPEVRFCVFPTMMVADWLVAGDMFGCEKKQFLAGDRHLKEFRSRLDPTIAFGWAGEDRPVNEVLSYYYKTDHHWNFEGAWQVYVQIHRLLSKQNPDMGVPFAPANWIEVPDVRFYGSLARKAGYYDRVSDVIVDGVFELPSLVIRVHGFEHVERHAKLQYQEGKYSSYRFAYHNARYFGTDYGLIEYTCASAHAGHLLVIGDSYDNCIEPLLASHFSRTWFVDTRLYARDVGHEFEINRFVAEHGVTDLLYLGNQYWVLGLRPMEPYGQR
jgi:hypothetical protein